ncbi:hypothetical protein [Dyella japonica]|uniref:Uncharacterized protein n=1 Tax=Dyella japonica A8 TaxID=1217721 RepID=A0A075K3I4_9GAMM|nr:hypothetical protein [Dyella japonica]AIF48272.1 hypothetical protein HY57_13965 [Dyella japonica A8]
MRKLIPLALVASLFAMPLMASAQHGHGGGGPGASGGMPASMSMNHDAHGDAVSAEAKSAKAADEKVGPEVRGVARDKSHGKGLTKTKGKGH